MNDSKVNMFISPIFNKKHKYHLSSYIQLKLLVRKLKKTSPSFSMMMEIYEFLKLIEEIYMYGNNESHFLFSATVPRGCDAAMVYKEDNFQIQYVLRKYDNQIAIKTIRQARSTKDENIISFNEGDNIIGSVEDEQKFLFITSCLMSGLCELIEYYYKNKKL